MVLYEIKLLASFIAVLGISFWAGMEWMMHGDRFPMIIALLGIAGFAWIFKQPPAETLTPFTNPRRWRR